jgi:murein DD-endopeptidase / murein LD-carboxypeptidase
MTGDDIAARAMNEVGTKFHIHGRTSGVALDCAGLVAVAIGAKSVRTGYSLKGNFYNEMNAFFLAAGFAASIVGPPENGDIALAACASNQQHLMIRAQDGWVHAHAGLGRVVHTPDPSPWPIIATWRICGE